MRSYLLILFLFFRFQIEGMTQQSFEGKYSGSFNYDQVQLELHKSDENHFTGKMKDSQQNYKIEAESNGSTFIGTAIESAFNIVFKINGSWHAQKLKLILQLEPSGNTEPMEVLFEKETVPIVTHEKKVQEQVNSINTFNYPKGASHNQELIGAWTKDENYNSGAGDNFMGASYSETLVLFENGTVGDGGTQTTISGNDFLGQSEGSYKSIPNVFWYNIANKLYVAAIQSGKTESSLIGNYFIENGNMLLTSSIGTKTLLHRR